jgi:hypothetical protein
MGLALEEGSPQWLIIAAQVVERIVVVLFFLVAASLLHHDRQTGPPLLGPSGDLAGTAARVNLHDVPGRKCGLILGPQLYFVGQRVEHLGYICDNARRTADVPRV